MRDASGDGAEPQVGIRLQRVYPAAAGTAGTADTAGTGDTGDTADCGIFAATATGGILRIGAIQRSVMISSAPKRRTGICRKRTARLHQRDHSAQPTHCQTHTRQRTQPQPRRPPSISSIYCSSYIFQTILIFYSYYKSISYKDIVYSAFTRATIRRHPLCCVSLGSSHRHLQMRACRRGPRSPGLCGGHR